VPTNTTQETNAPTRFDANEPRHATIKDVKNDISHLKHDAAGVAGDAAQAGMEAIQHGAEATLEAGRKAAETVGDTHKALCRHVSAHPTSSILIAMGVGALISRLLPRH
jgi:ElaB/YqjD/DUF883 family membrane-anchored ribosome-binding protein